MLFKNIKKSSSYSTVFVKQGYRSLTLVKYRVSLHVNILGINGWAGLASSLVGQNIEIVYFDKWREGSGSRSGTIPQITRIEQGAGSRTIPQITWIEQETSCGTIPQITNIEQGTRSGTIAQITRIEQGTRNGTIPQITRIEQGNRCETISCIIYVIFDFSGMNYS